MFRIGIGPSSSHTVGPMRAARRFAQELKDRGLRSDVAKVTVTLYGSLAATGKGHGTDGALILGLLGEDPETVDPDRVPVLLAQVKDAHELALPGGPAIAFDPRNDLDFKRYKPLPAHPNGMVFQAFAADGRELAQETIYSIGGGFLATETEINATEAEVPPAQPLPYPFANAAELVAHAQRAGLAISDIMLANELTKRSEAEIWTKLGEIWQAMQACVSRGIRTTGQLPGGLKVERRAPKLYAKLCEHPEQSLRDPLCIIDWVNLYALAVNEENAAGGRVVTAPTNGAAGIIPAVLHYAVRFTESARADHPAERFLLTAAAIGTLYKKNASISGADVGCQGEVGVACSMAAGALAEWLGGSPAQVENAAEIGMEHNLGLTCDPIGGLVQIPCIERNAMGSVKALNASRMALRGDGSHFVSLDKVIKTMRDTGRDMKDKYKETSRGGLAVNVIEC